MEISRFESNLVSDILVVFHMVACILTNITRNRKYLCFPHILHVLTFLAELVVDKAMELKYIGGVFGGNIKPTPFLCLILKMLQIQPEKDIVVEFITQSDFK